MILASGTIITRPASIRDFGTNLGLVSHGTTIQISHDSMGVMIASLIRYETHTKLISMIAELIFDDSTEILKPSVFSLIGNVSSPNLPLSKIDCVNGSLQCVKRLNTFRVLQSLCLISMGFDSTRPLKSLSTHKGSSETI